MALILNYKERTSANFCNRFWCRTASHSQFGFASNEQPVVHRCFRRQSDIFQTEAFFLKVNKFACLPLSLQK
ncbi:hypothetical protein CDL12_16642 [Handroanthus impetiginosus]|uniref:Uncharacterized protein n=1 Tax=Handroanthus impetiginosus TaxID=429701 RepID=A0A2G9GZW2_9LAMI|nr:hypothetical protein CDL12_16642 [Handroanthus impetiginosus]